MFKFFRFFFIAVMFCFAGSSYADPNPPAGGNTNPPASGGSGDSDLQRQLSAALKREEEAKAELEVLKGKNKKKTPDPDNDDDGDDGDDSLRDKARKDSEAKAKRNAETKEVERAMQFNLTIDTFAKENKDFIPAEVEGILKQAAKENYDSALERAAAMKAAIVQSFFSVQANVDALTPSQRRSFEEWNRLTKNARETKAPDIYENIFEPAIDTARRVKKAEEVGRSRSGLATQSNQHEGYKAKLIRLSEAAYLGKKTA